MAPVPNPHERLDSAIRHWSDLVLVGVVINETRVERPLGSAGRRLPHELVPSPNQSKTDRSGTFRSTIQIEAVLKGQYAGDVIELSFLSDNWLCVGGPRLEEGNMVLLLLKRTATWTNSEGPQGFIWQTALLGGQVLLTKGYAFMDDYQARREPRYLGTADEVITHVATSLGSRPEDTEAALTSAASGIAEIDKGSEWSRTLAAVALGSTMLAFGLMAGVIHYRLRRVGP